jgi:signal peptidase I
MSLSRLIILFFCLVFIACKQKFYKVPSANMAGTIPVGSKVIIGEADSYERNDIVAYEYFGNNYTAPTDEEGHFPQHWETRISRIIAVSGDSLLINEGNIFINGKEIQFPEKAQLLYHIYSTEVIEELQNDRERFGEAEKLNAGIRYTVYLTRDEANKYANRKDIVVSVKKSTDERHFSDTIYATDCASNGVSTDYYGPFYIPKPGDTIEVKPCNRKFYKNIPGIQEGMNIIREKLFFLIGDNRYASEDSRFIGLIPESHVKGKLKGFY